MMAVMKQALCEALSVCVCACVRACVCVCVHSASDIYGSTVGTRKFDNAYLTMLAKVCVCVCVCGLLCVHQPICRTCSFD
jgi:hypothetical protein